MRETHPISEISRYESAAQDDLLDGNVERADAAFDDLEELARDSGFEDPRDLNLFVDSEAADAIEAATVEGTAEAQEQVATLGLHVLSQEGDQRNTADRLVRMMPDEYLQHGMQEITTSGLYDEGQINEIGRELDSALDRAGHDREGAIVYEGRASLSQPGWEQLGSFVEQGQADEYTGMERVATHEAPEVIAAGGDAESVERYVEEARGPYFANRLINKRGAPPASVQFESLLRADLKGVELVGHDGAQLDELLGQKKGDLAGSYSRRITDGEERFSIDEVRDEVHETLSMMERFAQRQPEVFAAMRDSRTLESGNLFEAVGPVDSRLEQYAASAKVGARIAEVIPQVAPIVQETLVGDLTVEDYVARAVFKNSRYNEALRSNEIPEETFRGLEALGEISQVPELEGLNKNMLANMFTNRTREDGHFETVYDVMTSDATKSIAQTEAGAEQLKYAGLAIERSAGRFDMAKSYAIVEAMEHPSATELSDIIHQAEAIADPEKQEAFYSLAERYMARSDKNGNPYDSPAIVRGVVEIGSVQDREWFTSDDRLPLAAFDSVAYFRDRAVENGVDDSPLAVYEWVNSNPETITELSSHNLTEYTENMFKDDPEYQKLTDEEKSQFVEDAIEQARGLSREMSDDARVFINIHPETLATVSEEGGALKSALDLDGRRQNHNSSSTYSLSYMQARSGVEIGLGIRSLDETEDHPIYGSTGFVGDGVPAGAYGYGEVMLSFAMDDALTERTTFTPEDSFHGAHRLTAEDAQAARILKTAEGKGSSRTDEYVEAQIRGGLDIASVDAVYVRSEEALLALPAHLREKARVVRGEVDDDGTYASRREKALFEELRKQYEPITHDGDRAEHPAAPVVSQNRAEEDSGSLLEQLGSF